MSDTTLGAEDIDITVAWSDTLKLGIARAKDAALIITLCVIAHECLRFWKARYFVDFYVEDFLDSCRACLILGILPLTARWLICTATASSSHCAKGLSDVLSDSNNLLHSLLICALLPSAVMTALALPGPEEEGTRVLGIHGNGWSFPYSVHPRIAAMICVVMLWFLIDPRARAVRELSHASAALDPATQERPSTTDAARRRPTTEWQFAVLVSYLKSLWSSATTLLACGVVLTTGILVADSSAWFGGYIYKTPGIERRQYVLSDHTVVTLDKGSSLTANIGMFSRQVHIHRGQVRLEVAPYWKTPLIVTADDLPGVSFQTESTSSPSEGEFSVQILTSGSLELVVFRGSLHLGLPPGLSKSIRWPTEVGYIWEGSLLTIDKTHATIQPLDEVTLIKRTLWQLDRISFRNTPLPDALAQLQPYASGLRSVADDDVSGIFVNGMFPTDLLEFLKELSKGGIITFYEDDQERGKLHIQRAASHLP